MAPISGIRIPSIYHQESVAAGSSSMGQMSDLIRKRPEAVNPSLHSHADFLDSMSDANNEPAAKRWHAASSRGIVAT
jgi:hypothetical protein